MRLKAKWWVRGGIYTTVVAEHRKPGWAPQPMVELPEFGNKRPGQEVNQFLNPKELPMNPDLALTRPYPFTRLKNYWKDLSLLPAKTYFSVNRRTETSGSFICIK